MQWSLRRHVVSSLLATVIMMHVTHVLLESAPDTARNHLALAAETTHCVLSQGLIVFVSQVVNAHLPSIALWPLLFVTCAFICRAYV